MNQSDTHDDEDLFEGLAEETSHPKEKGQEGHGEPTVLTEEDEVNLAPEEEEDEADYQKEYEEEFGAEDRREQEDLEVAEGLGADEEEGGDVNEEEAGTIIHGEEAEGEEEEEEEDDGPLPCVLLEYDSQFFVLFGDSEGIDPEDILFRGDRAVYGTTMADFIRELKHAFDISTDVTLEIPQLQLSFPQDLIHSQSIRFRTLALFHQALHRSTEKPEDVVVPPLKIALFDHKQSFVKQYNKLWNNYKKGGRRDDPIVLSDDEEESAEKTTASKGGVITLDDDSQQGANSINGATETVLPETSPAKRKGDLLATAEDGDGTNKRQRQDSDDDSGGKLAADGN